LSSINVPFRLINYRESDETSASVQVGLEVDGYVVPLTGLRDLPGTDRLIDSVSLSELTPGVQGLLTDWPRSFEILSSLADAVEHGGETLSRHAISLTGLEVLAPILRPTKMLFAGANYERHVKEVENWEEAKLKNFQGIDRSVTKPYAFLKLPYCIIGPFNPVIYPRPHRKLDWEGELALVIGQRGKHISAERAMEHVAGFTIVNDYSLRDLTMRSDWPGLASDWLGGKNFDTSAALGPYLVPKEFVPNYLDLRMTLRVNGEVKQNTSTQEMVFKPNEIIEWVSSIVTLEPGDIIATGSPPGAGFATGTYLDVGDVVEAEIEGLGRQRNEIVEGDGQLK
jgi:2-keto-4-pentenoate hydratase/2-oxohepta-3-ene-1,7-dioic acid hydratase in catechol pathway